MYIQVRGVNGKGGDKSPAMDRVKVQDDTTNISLMGKAGRSGFLSGNRPRQRPQNAVGYKALSLHNHLAWIKGLEVLLWLCFVFLGVRAVMLFFTPSSFDKIVNETHKTPVDQHTGHNHAVGDYNVGDGISLNFDPFYRDAQLIQTILGQSAPETSLQLRLYGRRTGGAASAIIETPDGKQKPYGIKDEILQNVILQAVHKDYVVISRRGTLERLTFDASQTTGLAADLATGLATGLATDLAAPMAAGGVTKAQRETTSNNISGTANRNAVWADFKLKPAFKNNAHIGFTVHPRHDGIKLAKFGLRDGDIITDIDGIKLVQDPAAIRDIVHAVQGKNQIELKVLRQGKTISRVVTLQ